LLGVFGFKPQRLKAVGLFGLMAVVCLVLAGSSYVQAERSSFVQAHGIQALGTVASVENSGGKLPSAAVAVNLLYPANLAQSSTTVHVPNEINLATGKTASVLVDPNDPGYAEFPGVVGIGIERR
jgi:hypothetical protein